MAKRRVVIKRVNVMSLGKIFCIFYAVMGFIFGAVITLASLFGAVVFSSSGGNGGFFFGIGSIVILPIIYGIMGGLSGWITAFIYNLVASWVGGLEVETG